MALMGSAPKWIIQNSNFRLMKNTLALVLMVIGLVGCVSAPKQKLSKDFSGWNMSQEAIMTTNNQGYNFLRTFGYKYDPESYTVFIKTDGEHVFNNKNCGIAACPTERLYSYFFPNLCNKFAKTKMKLANDSTYRSDDLLGGNWKFYPQITSATCYKPGEYEAQQKINDAYWAEQAEKLKLEVIERKKSKCREYGFKDDSDGMGLCLIELDKLAAIKNQSEQANQAQLNILQQQQAEAKRQREANALMNLGAIIGGAGTPAPSSTRSKVTTPSYPTYTSSRTVPSNQLCPQLASRLVKQEVVRGNRICYYQ